MASEDQVRQALRQVLDPEIGRPIEDIGMLQSIEIDGGVVRVHVLLTIEGCPLKDRITTDVTAAVQPLEGVERVEVRLTPMSQEQRERLVHTLRGGAPGACSRAQDPGVPALDVRDRGGLGQGRRGQVERHREPRRRARGRGQDASVCSTPTCGASASRACWGSTASPWASTT